jgi:polyisoprenoid-binding protein YceI
MYLLAQKKLETTTGKVFFEASVPLFEEISAENNAVNCLLNLKDNSIIFSLKIKDFKFKRDLMYTHFNEIYLESDQYPRATFKGSVPNFELDKISPEGTILKINGVIKIHGVSKPISVSGVFKRTKNHLNLIAKFILDTDDFEINIPSMIVAKISKKVQTHLECTLQ